MGYNFSREREKFERRWVRLAREYRAAGMCCAQINAIYDFDYRTFCRERSFYRRSADKLPDNFWEVRPELETEDQYFQDIEEHLDVLLDELCPGLSKRATTRDKEILKLRLQGFTQAEIAEILSMAQQTVSRHIQKIKKYFTEGV